MELISSNRTTMKNFNTKKQMLIATFTVALLSLSLLSSAQQRVKEYSFRNPVLESGVDKQDGAIYRFPNVSGTLDALVTISARSSVLVNLDAVDVTSTGYDKTFQPQVSYNGGTAQGPVSWWMEFQVKFVNTGTNTVVQMDSVDVTALDIDGDAAAIQEQFTAYGTPLYRLNSPSSLTIDSVSGGTRFTGPIANSPGIDTTATNVMVTLTYVNQNSITFRYGGEITGSSSSGAASRFNSVWFKAFNYDTLYGILPMNLLSFTASSFNKTKSVLNWSVASENAASHFEIERSTDGNAFTEEAIVLAKEGNNGTSVQFTYADDISTVKSNIIYYRLKMVSDNGTYKYSTIAMIRLSSTQNALSLNAYPNPAVSQISVTIPSDWQNKTTAYNIYTLSGNLIKQKISNSAAQTETFNISNLPTGMYIVKVVSGNEMLTQHFIKKS